MVNNRMIKNSLLGSGTVFTVKFFCVTGSVSGPISGVVTEVCGRSVKEYSVKTVMMFAL